MSDTIDSLKDAEKESMIEESRPRPVRRRSGNTTGGLILIGIGVFFLVKPGRWLFHSQLVGTVYNDSSHP